MKKAGAPRGNKNAAGNKGGAPSKYKPEFKKQVEKLCLLGATDKELADFFEVSEDTINEWKKKHVEFSESLKKGKLLADATVSEKLYRRACGYSCPDTDIKVIRSKIVKTSLVKHYPPDTTAAIFWLKNRQRDKWRDKHEIDYNNLSDDQLTKIIDELTRRANATTQNGGEEEED